MEVGGRMDDTCQSPGSFMRWWENVFQSRHFRFHVFFRRRSAEASAAGDDAAQSEQADRLPAALPGDIWEPAAAAHQCRRPQHGESPVTQHTRSGPMGLCSCSTAETSGMNQDEKTQEGGKRGWNLCINALQSPFLTLHTAFTWTGYANVVRLQEKTS